MGYWRKRRLAVALTKWRDRRKSLSCSPHPRYAVVYDNAVANSVLWGSMRHIFSQGDYDGACFLYAVANAYAAVTGQRPPCDAWDQGIRALKHAHDFLGGCIGTTEHFSATPHDIPTAVSIMLKAFNNLGPRVQWAHLPALDTLEQLASYVDERAVVIFHYQGKTAQIDAIDHWVCAVASTMKPLALHLACSYRKVDADWHGHRRYRERYHKQVKRYSNNWLGLHHECRIVAGSVFRIWRDETGQDTAKTETVCH